jgi:BioD-like phosphotransacetylase family protein
VIAILVVSSERYSGKSSLVVGLSLELVDRGYSVGYMKPVGSYPMKVDHERSTRTPTLSLRPSASTIPAATSRLTSSHGTP